MTAVLECDAPPATGARTESARTDCPDVHGWIARAGSSVEFLLAAELTFARAVEQAAEEPDEDTVEVLATARRRMLDAAAIVEATGPTAHAEAADLLGSALAGVRDLADRTNRAPVGHISVARRILAVEGDLAGLIGLLTQLRTS